MAETRFAIVFQGQIAAGADPATVRKNLAKLFNADAERIEKMFSGQKVVIKKGLDSVAAGKYKVALGKAGALVDAVAMAAAEPAAAATPAPLARSPTQRRVPPSDAPQTVPAAYAAADNPPPALDTSLAAPGETLVDYQPPASPDIATDHLSVAEVGATLVEPEQTPAPEFDFAGLSLDPPGTTLVEPETIAPPEFDTSAMSLEETP